VFTVFSSISNRSVNCCVGRNADGRFCSESNSYVTDQSTLEWWKHGRLRDGRSNTSLTRTLRLKFTESSDPCRYGLHR
jgi:hypothetical protein